ncbi:hypothetical protein EKH79_03620 [Dyella dinghuensis]|uniref:DUF2384 domain-containing protein n=1 Tax=Dyella dinghuensis TaxID=1920169 RepID=A0A3S0PHI0_9GAMM|nr:hypothetical protein [Dyella dinghuensis]RUL65812.1 hypothetical protein EKH79_03620 [Dyella dinghuensis]
MAFRIQLLRKTASSVTTSNQALHFHGGQGAAINIAVAEVLSVLRTAQEIEPNPNAVIFWYQHVKIRELDSMTAEQLVLEGRATDVVRFLRAIQSGVRHEQ